MKEFIMISSATVLAIAILLSIVYYFMPDNSFDIKKTKQGYDIYRAGKLEFEFTKENCDSMSLETLRLIYEGDN